MKEEEGEEVCSRGGPGVVWVIHRGRLAWGGERQAGCEAGQV